MAHRRHGARGQIVAMTMKCPRCEVVELTMADRQGIEIDYCRACRGVWLDRDELDKIIDRSMQFNPAPTDRGPAPTPRPDDRGRPADTRYDDSRRDRDDDRRYRDDDDDDRNGRRGRRREGFLGEIFDIFD